jgi:hypothetical protein
MFRVSRYLPLVAALIVGALAATTTQAQDDFASQIAAARESFQPVTDEQLAAARSALKSEAQSLERYLRPGTANGKRWLAYLKLEAAKQQVNADGEPDSKPLLATYEQLNRDEAGLELAPFRKISTDLRGYLDLAVLKRQPDQAAAYGQQLDALANDLGQYEAAPNANLAAAVGNRLDFLMGIGQANELVDAIRARLSHPNAFVTVSEGLLRGGAADPINRRDPITDVILGTRIRGRGHTTGSVSLQTVPNDKMAVIELDTRGRVVSQNIGRNGPAVIRSTGYTDFTAMQDVEFSDSRFRALPARVSARTNSTIHSVSKAGGGIGSRMVANIGTQKANEKKGQANRIAAQHAEVRIARRMNDEVDKRLKDAWERYQTDYRNPLVRRGALPDDVRFSTTNDALHFQVTQAGRSTLGAPDAAPEAPADRDMCARVHETALNNYTAVILGGATISESDPKSGTKADVSLPTFIKDAWKNRMDEKADEAPDADFEPWSLTFRRNRPVTVAFVDGKVKLTLHIANLKSGEDVFDNWDVTSTYTAEMTDGGVTLRRDGDLEVLPTGFDPTKRNLSSRQVALRSNLTKVLTERSDKGRGIPQKIEVAKIVPTGKYADVGPLLVTDFASNNGWLTVAWNRE